MKVERILTAKDGYDKTAGLIADMISKSRTNTIELVRGLEVEQLDHMNEYFVNSIGKLAMHICAVEKGYISFFRGVPMTMEETIYWKPFLSGQLSKVGKLNREFRFYEEKLQELNYESLEILKSKDDSWLLEILEFDTSRTNRLFYFFHRLEDEMNHQGQMKLIRKII